MDVDETFVAGKNKNRDKSKNMPNSQGRAHIDKTAVIGPLQRDGKVKTYVVNDNRETLHGLMVANVAPQAVVITDAYFSYKGLDKFVSQHMTVKHAEGCDGTQGKNHTNGIEGFWSIFKRGIIGICHYTASQHLHRYCAEFTTRYNER